jgi:hypothetical protein
VTITAQGTSYTVFAILILSGLVALPQIALVIGAGMGAAMAYLGHRFFAFKPKAARA